jgi:hypothetical protein
MTEEQKRIIELEAALQEALDFIDNYTDVEDTQTGNGAAHLYAHLQNILG